MKGRKQLREIPPHRPPPGFNVIALVLFSIGAIFSIWDFVTNDERHISIGLYFLWLVVSVLGLLCTIAATARSERVGFLTALAMILNGLALVYTLLK